MALEKHVISAAHVELALGAPEELLQPGVGADVLHWINSQAVPQQHKLGAAAIWLLSEQDIRHFSGDLSEPTPARYPAAQDHVITRYGILQLAMARSFGVPFGVTDQRNGVLIQDVFPRDGLLDRPNSGLGAHQPFDFHTDQAFSADPAKRPDYVTLACVRNHERATTGIVAVSDVLEQLPADVLSILEGSQYGFYRGRPEEAIGVDTGAIIVHNKAGTAIRLGGDTLGLSDEATEALKMLRQVLSTTPRASVALEPGEVLVFHNGITIHIREGFKPMNCQAERRWIQKIYIK